jgi:hypothetical protein
MNGDEVVRERTLYLFVPSEFPTVGCISKSLTELNICDCLDVRFALLTVSESCRVCSNYEFLGEILNMY